MSRIKRALITGSTSGIGLAIAHQLAVAGTDVVLHGLESQQEGDKLATSFHSQHGVEAIYVQADISDPDNIAAMMSQIATQVGPVTILVNNAGIQHTAPLEDFPPQKWDQILAVNLSAAFHTTRLAIPAMQAQGWGRIINISSVHGLVASVHKSAYCAAKHGLIGMTKVTALELATKGITANCICPGWTDTPLLVEQFKAYAQDNNTSYEEAKQGLIKAKALTRISYRQLI
ncbi:3-hydroxybutyrate dehydrogenase [Nitrincola sp. A-D6]|uniref:3-hydroxybutyrate dehydrogenase n=1 Tax=Nitrincola sp. A-D6 TaxID=1545442 RepID=UPI000A8036E3